MNTKKKYEALRQELIDYIRTNKLGPNDQLPTVRDILRNSDYSYATLNRTLLEMERDGLIIKRQGKGLYVNRLITDAQSAKQISLIIPKDFTQHRIFLDILGGVRTAAEKLNFGLNVSISNMSHEKEKETIEKLVHQHADGMIIFLEDNYRNDYSHIVGLQRRKYPFVLIDRFIPDLDTDYVVINNWDAMHRVCAYLRYKRECENIIFIPSNDTSIAASSSDEKLLGYKDAMKMLYGDASQIIPLDEFVARSGELSTRYRNFGVCLNHDTMIPDMHSKFKAAGKSIPANCHIFGYNNSYDPPYYPTVEQFNDQVGMRAAEILMDKITDPNRTPVQIRITPKLVLPDGQGKYHLED